LAHSLHSEPEYRALFERTALLRRGYPVSLLTTSQRPRMTPDGRYGARSVRAATREGRKVAGLVSIFL
jgi:hypothetical protein